MPKQNPKTALRETKKVRDLVNIMNVRNINRDDLKKAMDFATRNKLNDLLRYFDRKLSGVVDDIAFADNLNEKNIVILQSMAAAYDSVNEALGKLLDYTSNTPTFANSSAYNDFLGNYYTACVDFINGMALMGKSKELRDLFHPELFLTSYDLSKMFITMPNGDVPNMVYQAPGNQSFTYYAADPSMTATKSASVALAPVVDYIKITYEASNYSNFVQLNALPALYAKYTNTSGDDEWAPINSGATGGVNLSSQYPTLDFTHSDSGASDSVAGGLYSQTIVNNLLGGTGLQTIDNSSNVYINLWDIAQLGADANGNVIDLAQKDLSDEFQFVALSSFAGQFWIRKTQSISNGQWYVNLANADSSLPDATFASALAAHLNSNAIHAITYLEPAIISGNVISRIDFPTQQFSNSRPLDFTLGSDLVLVAPPYFPGSMPVNNVKVDEQFRLINENVPSYQDALGYMRDKCNKIIGQIELENNKIRGHADDVYDEFLNVQALVSDSLSTQIENLEKSILLL